MGTKSFYEAVVKPCFFTLSYLQHCCYLQSYKETLSQEEK